MKSSQNTLWVAGAGVLAALLVLATYLLVIAPQRTEAADLQTQRVSVEQSNAEIEQRTALLRSQFATLDEKKAELAAIQAQLPSASEVPALLRQVSAFAAATGVRIDQVTPGTPEAYGTTPTTTSTGIVSVPLTIGVTGTFPQVELYVKTLQADMQRHFSITGLTVGADQSANAAGGVTATLNGAVFVVQDGATVPAGTVADAATGTTTTTGPSTATGATTTATVS
ncbi:type IV pilus assembly protein PilO [Kineococcus radiotolerans]|uniref:Type IV pilus assembly protein PilO n=1 Tax=Kineococcus radiotolerans TaxID=131568 RepID=A0A7W4TPV6_KINRA|nr:type 4a pilus biogenesis protein PilO [Kineococcus radiotolerans]MBB2902844.1 type IV pilus assembly protein PilO [Kineococcus radiotolerans]